MFERPVIFQMFQKHFKYIRIIPSHQLNLSMYSSTEILEILEMIIFKMYVSSMHT